MSMMEDQPNIVRPGGKWVAGIVERGPTQEELDNFEITPEKWIQALKDFDDDANMLIRTASLHRNHGVSHRNPPFLVGAVAVGIEPNQSKGHYGSYQSHNFTPTPKNRVGDEKMCAESNALNAAKGFAKVVVGIVTVSRETNTGDPTKSDDVLHPCLDCRRKLRKLLKEGFIREDSIMYNVNDADPNNIKKERRTLKEVLDLYHDDEQ